jgi:hypothetical protein
LGIIPVDQIRGRLYGSLIFKNVYNGMQADNFNLNPVLIQLNGIKQFEYLSENWTTFPYFCGE